MSSTMDIWKVIEHYCDGGEWHHGFTSEHIARQQMADMQEAHPARTYELIDP